MWQGSGIYSHLAIQWLLLKNNVKDGLYSSGMASPTALSSLLNENLVKEGI